ncbi:MAG: hypothetical protein JOY82_08710 [Streptosporangiaceae bacterium]|nr:hypothetical protein [Streptosporangiaceae bacterium]MBV9854595.1 hypothetical protein [Streptosporangiaceae bacterium]
MRTSVKPEDTPAQGSAQRPLLPPRGATGLNGSYPWVGGFRSGTELWCFADGMLVVCRGPRRG